MPMSLVRKRQTVLAAFGFSMAALLFPVPLAAWFSIVVPAEHHTGAWLILSRLATGWVHVRGYLPWRAWAVLTHHPNGFLAFIVLALAWAGLFAYMGRDRQGSSSDWGGPPAAGAGQHGTARWRKQTEMLQGFEIWEGGINYNGRALEDAERNAGGI